MGKTDFTRLLAMLKERSVEHRRTVLSSGEESNFYINCKRTILRGEGHRLVANVLGDVIDLNTTRELWPRAVAGVELGGCALASAVALNSQDWGYPMDAIYVRKERKRHGSRELLEGYDHLSKGDYVVLLEDVVTTGTSALRALEVLRNYGFVVPLVIALVDRQEGARKTLIDAGVTFRSVYSKEDLVG